MGNNVTIVSPRLMDSVISKADFYTNMPEFAHLKVVKESITSANQTTGCRSCNKRRMEHQIFSMFCMSLLKLPKERLAVFKEIAGVNSLQFHGLNPVTGKYEVKIF